MRELLKKSEFISSMLDFILPPLCLGCDEYCDNESNICDLCLNKIEEYEYPICLNCNSTLTKIPCHFCKDKSLPVFIMGEYRFPLDEIIKQFKFKGITHLSSFFSNLIISKYKTDILNLKADCIVPVPLHYAREKERGYNQAELMAKQISHELNLPFRTDLIIRAKKRKPQVKSKLSEREKNIKDVFQVINKDEKLRIIILDDVVTSGATMKEVANTLNKNNHKVVGAIAVAHSV